MKMHRVLRRLLHRSSDNRRADLPTANELSRRKDGEDASGPPDVSPRTSQQLLSTDGPTPLRHALSWPARDLARSRRLPRTEDANEDVDSRGMRSPPVDGSTPDDETVVWRRPGGKKEERR